MKSKMTVSNITGPEKKRTNDFKVIYRFNESTVFLFN